MPLYKNAAALIRANLELCEQGKKPPLIAIGFLTQQQLDAINAGRQQCNPPLAVITAEIVFDGRHMYKSRCKENNYTFDEVIEQIESAVCESAEFMPEGRMTTITATTVRKDRRGNHVVDRAVFECSQRHPRPELYSVIPRGDKIRPSKLPAKSKQATQGRPTCKNVTDSPG
jgi:hypothetical protein